MKYNKYIFLAALASTLTLTSCDDFLDQLPDERTEIDTEDKVLKLLTGSYPDANYCWVAELSSDNLIDNQAPHMPTGPWDKQVISHYNYRAYDIFDDELFRFDAASTATYTSWDSPGTIWSSYYQSVASVNNTLAAIDKLVQENKGDTTATLKAAIAEAKLLRAFDHFILVNIFSKAYKNDTDSKQDVGVPYVTEVEDVVQKTYSRSNVADVYANIQRDLEEGLRLQDDAIFQFPKWHFNSNAAHAFAARFYLYKRDWEKVIQHADAVLGTDSAAVQKMMMDYSVFVDCSSSNDYGKAWQHPDRNNNLMLLSTNSILARKVFGYRYSLAGPTAREVLMISTNNPLWSRYYYPAIAIVSGMLFSSSSGDYGFFNCKIDEEFEYSDKIAGIGYPHVIQRLFTSNELLLERAEAKVMLNKLSEAADDIRYYWNCSINNFSEDDKKAFVETGYIKYFTNNVITSYYANSNHSNCFENWDFTASNVSSDYVVSAAQVPYMNCINELRRFETHFEGHRFFDLKRWGVEYSHVIGVHSEEVKLTGNDDRRAIEVPWEALSAGMETSRPTMKTLSRGKDLENNALKYVVESAKE